MLTDAPPRKANRSGFLESDRIKTLDLPKDGCLPRIAKSIEDAMKAGKTADVRRACAKFLAIASEFYGVPPCGVRVLAARPLRVREQWTTELFGDYSPETMLIRVWMRTAVRIQGRGVVQSGFYRRTRHLESVSKSQRLEQQAEGAGPCRSVDCRESEAERQDSQGAFHEEPYVGNFDFNTTKENLRQSLSNAMKFESE